MTRCTLVTGDTAGQRTALIAAALDPRLATVVIAEGLQDGAALPGALVFSDPASRAAPLRMITIAASCPHCDGGLVMRVTLDRILRHPPAALFISLLNAAHLAHLQQFLSNPPYVALLTLEPALQAR